MGYVLRYEDGTFVSEEIRMDGQEVVNSDGVCLEKAKVYERVKSAERAVWTLRDCGGLEVVLVLKDGQERLQELEKKVQLRSGIDEKYVR